MSELSQMWTDFNSSLTGTFLDELHKKILDLPPHLKSVDLQKIKFIYIIARTYTSDMLDGKLGGVSVQQTYL